jgi:hypothetical protein
MLQCQRGFLNVNVYYLQLEFYLEWLRLVKYKANKDDVEIIGPSVTQCLKVTANPKVPTPKCIGNQFNASLLKGVPRHGPAAQPHEEEGKKKPTIFTKKERFKI